MKKKLFAFMLSYACFASNSHASLDLAGHLPHGHSIRWCLNESPLEFQKPFELMCGDAERLASLMEAARAKPDVPPSEVAVDTTEDSSLRPPTLSQPTAPNDPNPDQVSGDPSAIASTIGAPILTPEILSWAQESIVSSTKTVAHWVGEPRRRTFEAAAALLIKKSRSSYSDSIATVVEKNPEVDSDPIRHQLVVEDYRPYDLSFSDNLRIAHSAFQSLACEAFAHAFQEQQEIKAIDRAIAESERLCSPSSNQIASSVPQEVVVKPLQLRTQGSAYFVRQIPIDYEIVSEATAMTAPSVEQAEIIETSDMSQIAEVDLATVFGTSVLPIIDFNSVGFNPYVFAKSLALYRYSHSNTTSSFETLVVDQLPKTSWLKESIYEHGNQVLRQSVAMGLSQLRHSLNRAQALVESLEVAISEGENVKVANKQSLNR